MLAAALVAVFPWVSSAEEIGSAGRPVHREVKGDLTLDEAVEIALRQNPNLLRQIQEIERTRGIVIEARSAALPHLVLNSSYEQQDRALIEQPPVNTSQPNVPNVQIPIAGSTQTINLADLFKVQNNRNITEPDKTWQVSLEVNQLLYSGGQVLAATNAAKFGEDSAYWQLRDTIDSVVALTRSQFYTVLTDRQLITVAQESVTLQEDLLKDQKNRFEAGTVPRFNVLQAEVALANVIPNLIQARENYLIARLNLGKTLGLDPGPGGKPTFNAVGELKVVDVSINLVDALDLAKARRPFLKVQRQQIKIQAENIKIALAGYKPTLSAHAGYLVRNSHLSDDIDDVVNGWFFGFTGTWNIFDGGATYGRVKQTRAQLEQAKVSYDDAVQQVELETQQAYANVQTQRETIRSQQKNVEQAIEALRLANERLAAGAGTQLDVLNSRTALTQARTTELSARGAYNSALAELDRTMAVQTMYVESFKDPLMKLERRVIGETKPIVFPPKLKKCEEPVKKPVRETPLPKKTGK
jgi:outer membrane protein TolC